MNAVDELIRLYAKQLKIPSFAEYQEVLRQADPSAGFSDLLLELMKAETASRQENQNRRRLKAAGFPYLKTMEEFDCSQLNDAVSPLFLQELASCQFIQNRQNVIMIGNPGRGKTHLAIALGLKACTQGYNVLFKNAATLSTELCEAKDNYHLGKLERTLAKADLLILDELSYLSFNRHQSELLFKVISDRSEKSSTIQDDLLSGEISTAVMYTSQVTMAMLANPELKIVYPSEGIGFGIMGMFIPSAAPHSDAAYKFMEYILDPEVSAQCFEYLGYYCTNLAAEEYIHDEFKSFLTLPADFNGDSEMIGNISAEAEEAQAKVWTEFKTATGN